MDAKRCGIVAMLLGVAGAWTAEVVLRTGPTTVTLADNGQVVAIRSATGEAVPHLPQSPFVAVFRQGKRSAPQVLRRAGDELMAEFADPPLAVRWQIEETPGYAVLRLREVTGEPPESVAFLSVSLAPSAGEQGWWLSTVALNQDTNATGLPGLNTRGEATAYQRLDLTHGAAALTIAPAGELPGILKTLVTAAPDLPHSPVGGPWALDAPTARGSYLFAPANVSEQTVDGVIELADRLGLNQINLHAARFGDWQPYPQAYPEGRASLRRVVDRIHAAGMQAGIHTYCYFLNKQTPYVTPIPDPRLGKDAVFALAEDLPPTGTEVKVVESTGEMSAITGFFVRNSATVQIDEELIVYKVVRQEAPYAFVECTRGAHGTKVAAHAKGAQVQHLRECFGLFLPDGDSTLFTEVAANLASLINECGFDMVYLDALDGSDAVGGREWSWHYAAKFTFELFRHLDRPVLAEMSTFPHHQWFVRSRAGAWDHPVRSHKVFIDTHCQGNQTYERQLMPTHLGWWRFGLWQNFASEPTYPDDIDYLCAKALGYGAGISIQGVTPETLDRVPALGRLASVSRRWETLRRAGYFTPAAEAQLRAPGAEFALLPDAQGEWDLLPRRAPAHRVTGAEDGSAAWQAENPYGEQPLACRIEALASAQAKSKGTPRRLADFAADPGIVYRGREGVKASLAASALRTPDGEVAARFAVTDPGKQSNPWVHWARTFEPPLDLRNQPVLGLWVHGDGQGAMLNLKRQSPTHITRAAGDHYVVLDFTGWRWIELIEPEGERYLDCHWPYHGWYSIFRETTRLDAVSQLGVLLGNLPPGPTEVHLGPIQAIPLANPTLADVRLTVNGDELLLPFAPATGQTLELAADGWLRLLGTQGETLHAARLAGVPVLRPGPNAMAFACAAPATGERARAKLTVFALGDRLVGARAAMPAWSARDVEPPWTMLADVPDSRRWQFSSRQAGAALELRLRALSRTDHVARHQAEDAVVLDDFTSLAAFADNPENQYRQYVRSGPLVNVDALPGVVHALTPLVRDGQPAALYTARSAAAGGWCARGKRFAPVRDLSACTHLGFWLRGDGKGETLYLQLRDTAGKNLDFRAVVDFMGWRYLEFPLVAGDFALAQTEYAIVYYNGLPAGQEVACGLDDLRAFTVRSALRDPVVRVNDSVLRIQGEIPSGASLRYAPATGAECTAVDGATQRLATSGELVLRQGWNEIEIQAEGSPDLDLEATLIKHYAAKP